MQIELNALNQILAKLDKLAGVISMQKHGYADVPEEYKSQFGDDAETPESEMNEPGEGSPEEESMDKMEEPGMMASKGRQASPIDESMEKPADEAAESPDVQSAEAKSGEEKHKPLRAIALKMFAKKKV